jgi:hypothetical protein
MTNEPPSSQNPYGDIFGPLQHEISAAFMNSAQILPAMLEAAVAGNDDAITAPPEQVAEMLQKNLFALMQFVPQMAGALDIARLRITELEKRLAELEGGAAS